MKFTFLAPADVLVTVDAADEMAACDAFTAMQGEFVTVAHGTAHGHQLTAVDIHEDGWELYQADGETVRDQPACPADACNGTLVGARCTYGAGCLGRCPVCGKGDCENPAAPGSSICTRLHCHAPHDEHQGDEDEGATCGAFTLTIPGQDDDEL
ncbi:hypothetical protein OG594_46745 [Streptomyces sp. NBC_01214]|uniref:hypothetical protein n=1 Tax=Streptomyces sp. NBC_01214 TaxID=2903777 RepID=UPI0022579ECE|nr:hypothetical protein [Streptomyces sp. NBC_01214]MCX4808955.1 hypothetical protein [Streptomyces sp. NBC_01214]